MISDKQKGLVWSYVFKNNLIKSPLNQLLLNTLINKRYKIACRWFDMFRRDGALDVIFIRMHNKFGIPWEMIIHRAYNFSTNKLDKAFALMLEELIFLEFKYYYYMCNIEFIYHEAYR